MADEEKSWFGQTLHYGNEGVKLILFDYEQVYNDPWSLNSAIEIAGIIPVGKLLKGAKIAVKSADKLITAEKAVDQIKDAEKINKTRKISKSKVLCEADKKKYQRPKFRRSTRDEAWEKAKGADGNVRDPLTKEVMDKNQKWDMGHKPGYEFWKHQQSAAERGISREQFLKEYNDANHYRPELPSTNRRRVLEDKTDQYFGH